ncbi:iron-containing alcohol dehydrogenase [Cellulomonas sp. NTE-D12]|uniref:iron-containing alcohol dehydrogenase n=1 Tax=Cellulomonas sp. NTE-D12 TaxID=2962632 RepID=UPI003081D0B0|nr:alcohol dehydrogenase [Cellulomonas sp. NTE-D12]
MSTSAVGTLRLPARIHVGEGSRAQLPTLLAGYGRRALALVDPYVAGTPLFAELLGALRGAGLEVRVSTDVQPELPAASLDASGDLARAYAPDVILAVGGGSVLDAAKLVALLAAHGGPLNRYYGENAVPGPVTPVVAVPTTAGTGSEVTPVAVVSDPDRELKVGISSLYLVPAAAVVDSELALGAPAGVTAHSGIDALVHVVESYTAAPLSPPWDGVLPVFTGRNVFSDTIALEAAGRLARWLPVAVRDPQHREARANLAYGSLLGGMSFGATGTHLSHALQYPVGALTHTPHGLGTGLLLPYVLEAIRGEQETDRRLAELGAALGSSAPSTAGRVDDAISAIVRINGEIGLPGSLADLGVTADQLSRIAELGLASARLVAIAPVPVTHGLLLGILERAHVGALRERSTR